MRTRNVRGLAGAGVLLVALAACGGSNDDRQEPAASPTAEGVASAPVVPQPSETTKRVLPGSPPAIRTSAPPPPAAAPLNPATQAPPPAPGNLAACKTGQLSVRVIRQLNKAKNGPAVGLVALTNKGTRPCSLSGWPTVNLTRGGAAVGVPTMNVNQPRTPVAVALAPQRSAFAGLQWRSCPPTATGCRTGDGFRVGAPGSGSATAELAGFSTAEQKGFAVSRIMIGAIQPTTTDIINW
ncbi:DUF4232 domain-containing protein [Cryptosporangium minutisporangium]|uniref:DUF4232 domain-containing protein n=1 Tax=Cryptosporangium minutisporangium TaxID=113569 RepID=A0ABP6T9J9_9ACTN